MNEPRKIVIVDDHAMLRKGLASLIGLFPNHQILFDAANGNDMIAQLNPHDLPDIILMDIAMPQMDGYASTEWLQNNHPTIKVLALSTMDAETVIIKMIRSAPKVIY